MHSPENNRESKKKKKRKGKGKGKRRKRGLYQRLSPEGGQRGARSKM